MNDFIVTNFVSALIANDKQGKRTKYASRYASALIVTKKGRIRFLYGKKELYLNAQNSVFLPQGLNYVNECIEDSESIVINIHTLTPCSKPLQLNPIPYDTALKYYKEIKVASLNPTFENNCRILEIIYALAQKMFKNTEKGGVTKSAFIEKALLYMNENYGNSDIKIAEIANVCHISEIYLRKLFEKELGMSPYKKILEIRMNAARLLAKEKRSVKEIATSVGYSDVFQFSRAYKKYFGYSPSQEL